MFRIAPGDRVRVAQVGGEVADHGLSTARPALTATAGSGSSEPGRRTTRNRPVQLDGGAVIIRVGSTRPGATAEETPHAHRVRPR
jgi:hypothetical protein